MTFTRATKKAARLRMAFVGPAGSGKTFSALRVGRALVGPQGKIAVMDTEHGSASKYADLFEFDVVEPDSFNPRVYIDTIRAAEGAGYDALIIDSLSHAWMGKDGALEMVDRAAKRYQGNSYAGWRDVTPLHNEMVEAMLASKLHLIVTMRSKTEYVVEKDEKTGKSAPRKVGMQPVQRDGLEFEFDVVGDMDQDNTFLVTKTRCVALKGAAIHEPGEALADTLRAWLTDGAPNPALEPATDEDVEKVQALMAEREVSAKAYQNLKAKMDAGLTVADAAKAIEWLEAQPAQETVEA